MKEQISLEEVDLLTSKVLDEAISSDDFARLEVLLLNPVCRRRYLDLMLQESLLHWEESKPESLTFEDPLKPRLFPFPTISAVAAILVAVGGMIFIKFTDIMEDFYQSEKEVAFHKSNVDSDKPTNPQTHFSASGVDATFLVSNLSTSVSAYETAEFQAKHGIEVLLNNRTFDNKGHISLHPNFSTWSRLEKCGVPAENGVLPLSGSDMFKFSQMTIDVDSQIAEIAETIQVVDLRNLQDSFGEGSATVDAAVLFNQAHGVANDSTEFTLSIHALASSTENTHESLASSKSTILSDLSPQSWEEVKSEIVLPEKTDFLVLAFSAKKIGPDALVADASHHYADNLNINLSLQSSGVRTVIEIL